MPREPTAPARCGENPQVPARDRDVRVPEQLAADGEAGPQAEQVRRERMPEPVRGAVLRPDAGIVEQRVTGDVAVPSLESHAGVQHPHKVRAADTRRWSCQRASVVAAFFSGIRLQHGAGSPTGKRWKTSQYQ